MDLNDPDRNSDSSDPSQQPDPDEGSAGDTASWYYDLDDAADDDDPDYRDEPDEDDDEDDDFQGMCGK